MFVPRGTGKANANRTIDTGHLSYARSMTDTLISERQKRARAWFERLRDDICADLEALEDALPQSAPLHAMNVGRFRRTPWQRTDHSGADGGGGTMAMMHGRVFE